MRGQWEISSVSYITPVEVEIQTKKYFVAPVKCPSLFTDFNETYIVCNTCAIRMWFEVSGEYE